MWPFSGRRATILRPPRSVAGNGPAAVRADRRPGRGRSAGRATRAAACPGAVQSAPESRLRPVPPRRTAPPPWRPIQPRSPEGGPPPGQDIEPRAGLRWRRPEPRRPPRRPGTAGSADRASRTAGANSVAGSAMGTITLTLGVMPTDPFTTGPPPVQSFGRNSGRVALEWLRCSGADHGQATTVH